MAKVTRTPQASESLCFMQEARKIKMDDQLRRCEALPA
jgi:hypothetical protein